MPVFEEEIAKGSEKGASPPLDTLFTSVFGINDDIIKEEFIWLSLWKLLTEGHKN
jgi:hypothetical protein